VVYRTDSGPGEIWRARLLEAGLGRQLQMWV
jgi:hypothetical protein